MVTAERDEASPDRVISFSLVRRSYAIPVRLVSGLAEPGSVRQVIGAPAGVVGLGEHRGRLLTILDLPLLIDDLPTGDEPCLIRLARPLDHIALLVPATVRMRTFSPEHEDSLFLDPSSIVARLEGEIIYTCKEA